MSHLADALRSSRSSLYYRTGDLVRALSLDMARLLALVAGSLGGGLRWAVSGEMTDLTAVVAFLALSAVAGHVAVAAARVAGLASLTTTTAAVASSATTISSALTAKSASATATATIGATSLWAVTSDVTDL